MRASRGTALSIFYQDDESDQAGHDRYDQYLSCGRTGTGYPKAALYSDRSTAIYREHQRTSASANGIAEEEIAAIVPDDETAYQMGDKAKQEVANADEDGGKCISILKLWKEDGTVHISRSVKNLVLSTRYGDRRHDIISDRAVHVRTVKRAARAVWAKSTIRYRIRSRSTKPLPDCLRASSNMRFRTSFTTARS